MRASHRKKKTVKRFFYVAQTLQAADHGAVVSGTEMAYDRKSLDGNNDE
jgi:hypothetical protein